LDNPSNAGLSPVITYLDGLYTNNGLNTEMSRADFWALATIAAIEAGILNNNRGCTDNCVTDPGITFKWGRVDCATSPSTTEMHVFPGATMNRAEMMSYFNTEFGFTENEVTALMGAHTLGGARRGNSGYVGTWVSGERFSFNSKYYALLVENGVTYTNSAKNRRSRTDKKWQFDLTNTTDGSRLGFMLNTDMELAYDIDVNPISGTSCSVNNNECKNATTIDLVAKYASDSGTWMNDFKSVFEKMLEHGYGSNDLKAV